MYNRLNSEVRNLLHSIVELTYFMRGGMSYNELLYGMSYVEREVALDFVSDRVKAEMKSATPNY